MIQATTGVICCRRCAISLHAQGGQFTEKTIGAAAMGSGQARVIWRAVNVVVGYFSSCDRVKFQ
jgi:hypothetical protein